MYVIKFNNDSYLPYYGIHEVDTMEKNFTNIGTYNYPMPSGSEYTIKVQLVGSGGNSYGNYTDSSYSDYDNEGGCGGENA